MAPYSMQWSSATPGLLIILLDQSGSMLDRYDGDLTKSEFVCRAVNYAIGALIQRNLDAGNRAFVSVLGYDNYVHELCSGYLRDLNEMLVWIEPVSKDGCTNMKGALEMAGAVVEKWMADKPGHPAPVVINISDGAPYYDYRTVKGCMDETVMAVRELTGLSCEDGNVLLFNALIKKGGANIVFPSELEEDSSPEARFIFDISSEVPEAYAPAAARNGLSLKESSRGCIFGADGVQLVSLIGFGSDKGMEDIL